MPKKIVLFGTDIYDGSCQLRDDQEHRGKEDGHGIGEVTSILQEEEAVTKEAPDESEEDELPQSKTALQNTTEWQQEGEVLPHGAIGETVMEQHTIMDADPARVFCSNSDHARSDYHYQTRSSCGRGTTHSPTTLLDFIFTERSGEGCSGSNP